jgi:hypothetical protein
VARGLALDRLSLTTASILAIGVSVMVSMVFVVAARHAWDGGLSTRLVIWLGLAFHVVVVLMPLILSYDVFNYAMYGRILGIHHANPYVQVPADFPGDPFLRFTHSDWRSVPSVYGPGFSQLSVLIIRWVRDPAAIVMVFKVLAAASSGAAMLIVTAVATRIRPARAPFAALLFGWNPVVLFDVVAAGQIDALLALAVAVAFALLALGWNRPPRLRVALEIGATAVLTGGSTLKPTIGWLIILVGAVSVARQQHGRRLVVALGHFLVVAAVAIPAALPFAQTKNPSLGLSTLTMVAGDLLKPSPAVIVEAFLASVLGPVARFFDVDGFREVLRAGIQIGFFGLFVAALVGVVARIWRVRDMAIAEQGAAWGWTLLLFLLTAPFLFPRYIAWALPLAWVLPRLPRLGIVGLAASVRLVDPLSSAPVPPSFYFTFVDVTTAILGIAVTALLVALVGDLWARATVGGPLHAEDA